MKETSENHVANDSGSSKAKKDKKKLKKNKIESPDLTKLWSVKLYIKNIMGVKFSHTAYSKTKKTLIEHINSKYIQGEILPPKKRQ